VALDKRYRWVIGKDEDAGVEDVMGRRRVLLVGIGHGRGIFAIGVLEPDGEVTVDTRAWVSMPDETLDTLGYHAQSAAEEIRQQQRRRS
jgi:hypothetical protein